MLSNVALESGKQVYSTAIGADLRAIFLQISLILHFQSVNSILPT